MEEEKNWGLCPKCGRWQVLDNVCERCGCEVDKFKRVVVHTHPNRHERRRREKRFKRKYLGEKNESV